MKGNGKLLKKTDRSRGIIVNRHKKNSAVEENEMKGAISCYKLVIVNLTIILKMKLYVKSFFLNVIRKSSHLDKRK